MFDRRDVLKSAALAGSLAGGLVSGSAIAAGGGAKISPLHDARQKKAQLLRQRLLNVAQAQAVMEEYNLSGMIATDPINVYYLTNTQPAADKMGKPVGAAATLPRNPKEPTFLVTIVGQLIDMASQDRWAPEYIPVTAPANPASFEKECLDGEKSEPEGVIAGYHIDRSATLSAREQRWAAMLDSMNPAASTEWGVIRAMQQSGMDRGKIAVDDASFAKALNEKELRTDVEFVDGENIFKRIRYIKSSTEIALMRMTSDINSAAALSVIANSELGMDAADLEQMFLVETAVRGSQMKFFLSGFPLGGFPNNRIEEGKPFLFDAVSDFAGYLGDFGRTVVVGEPDQVMSHIVSCQLAARDAIFSQLKPGVKYSQIVQIGLEAIKKAGGSPDSFFVRPHSVGLQHTDQPYADVSGWRQGEDIILKAGMTITVDLPFVDIGVGAGHNEELILITDDGSELLTASLPDFVLV